MDNNMRIGLLGQIIDQLQSPVQVADEKDPRPPLANLKHPMGRLCQE